MKPMHHCQLQGNWHDLIDTVEYTSDWSLINSRLDTQLVKTRSPSLRWNRSADTVTKRPVAHSLSTLQYLRPRRQKHVWNASVSVTSSCSHHFPICPEGTRMQRLSWFKTQFRPSNQPAETTITKSPSKTLSRSNDGNSKRKIENNDANLYIFRLLILNATIRQR